MFSFVFFPFITLVPIISIQNEYIKYPVLYELSHKYLNENLPESSLPDRLEELKEAIRKEIRKELKVSRHFIFHILSLGRTILTWINTTLHSFWHTFQIKEGAERLREVAKDRRALSDVASIVKKSNHKLTELKSELHELESQIILTQANSNGKGEFNWVMTRTILKFNHNWILTICRVYVKVEINFYDFLTKYLVKRFVNNFFSFLFSYSWLETHMWKYFFMFLT